MQSTRLEMPGQRLQTAYFKTEQIVQNQVETGFLILRQNETGDRL